MLRVEHEKINNTSFFYMEIFLYKDICSIYTRDFDLET